MNDWRHFNEIDRNYSVPGTLDTDDLFKGHEYRGQCQGRAATRLPQKSYELDSS